MTVDKKESAHAWQPRPLRPTRKRPTPRRPTPGDRPETTNKDMTSY